MDYRCAYAKQTHEAMEKSGAFDAERFGFAQELVTQYGGDYIDDDATIFKISARDLYVLMAVLGYETSEPVRVDNSRSAFDTLPDNYETGDY